MSDEHIVHLPEPFEFEVGADYDYLRRGAGKTAWYVLLRTVASVFLNVYDRIVFGLKIRGLKNLRAVRKGGAVVICNHVHTMDCTFIDCAFPHKRMYYTTLESNFRIPVARHLMRWLGGVPIPTKLCTLKDFNAEIKRAIEKGSFVCMYPEGVLWPYYEGLRDFRDGAFKIAAFSKCPVVPLVITFREPKGLYRLYKKKPCVTMTVLPAVFPPDDLSPRAGAEAVKDECLSKMKEEIGQ